MRIHAWTVVGLLSIAAATLFRRGDQEIVPRGEPLGELPLALGSWIGKDVPLTSEVRSALGEGLLLNRVYRMTDSHGTANDPTDEAAEISLFIGYYPSQKAGESYHSPQSCIPGAGWSFEQTGVTWFQDGIGKRYRVGEYLISDGQNRDEVLYWYRSRGRTIANDYLAKLYTSLNSVRDHRTDIALVRIMTPLRESETRQDAQKRSVAFAQQITPLLPAYIPD